MRYLIYTVVVTVVMWTTATAQFPDNVKQLDIEMNKTKVLSGSLSEGQFVDLSFGHRSSVNCFTESQKQFFSGHHVFYTFEVPAGTKVLVQLNTRGDASLYGYMIPTNKYDLPPNLFKVSDTGCGASFKGEGELDQVMLKAGKDAMNVVIGVAGIEEADVGAYNLKITTRE